MWLFLVPYLLVSFFLSWRDEYRKVGTLKVKLDERMRRRKIAGELATLSEDGKRLFNLFLVTDDKALWKAIDQWDKTVEDYLESKEELGRGYVGMFRIGAGLPTGTVPPFFLIKSDQWHHLQTRLARLAEFMKELVVTN